MIGKLAVLMLVAYLALADDSVTKGDQTVYTNLTQTDWKAYFFGNSSESDREPKVEGRNRKGKDFFDFIGLGTGPETDPYLAQANELCLSGDLSECFKSRALSSLDDFFTKEGYYVTDNVRVVRMSEDHRRRLSQENYEFSSPPQTEETEWEQFVKFLLRKVERFVKSTALEVKVPDELTEAGRYSPRFVDEIASELNVIEDKKAGVVTRYRLKKLFIPLLIVLKLFKLKLLLFLPMILGIASFKKLLGFLAIVIPGMIGVFKLCKPQLYSTSFGGGHASYYHPPKYTAAGIGHGSPQYYSHHVPYNPSGYGYGGASEHNGYSSYDHGGYGGSIGFGKSIKSSSSSSSSGSVAFRDDLDHSQDLAYGGYRNSKSS